MIRNLADFQHEPRHIDADVLIVGAGIAGLLMAARLRKSNLRVVVVESGGRDQPDDINPLNEVVQLGDIYSGAAHGRFRCLGGTSTRWGGAMCPFLPEDLGRHTAGWDVEWDASYDELMQYLPSVEELFHLPSGDYAAPQSFFLPNGCVPAFLPRLYKWPVFKLRNVATLLQDQLVAENGPEIWLNATVTNFVMNGFGRIETAIARSQNGCSLTIRPKFTVIAAGAIESTRLLLLLDRQHDNRVFAPDDVLGRYFYDHLSAAAADVIPINQDSLNRLTGFRFERGGMRSLRFELTGAARLRDKLPAAFAYIAPVVESRSGLDALRNVFRALQQRALPRFAELTWLLKDSGWLARAIWWRYAYRRLLAPANSKFELHLVIEQMPKQTNRISLSSDRMDQFGCPLGVIDWHVGASDLQAFGAIYERFAREWRTSGLASVAKLNARIPEHWQRELVVGGGWYHPGGSIRIGTKPQKGVVDGRLKTFRVPDLWAVTTAVFPSGGTANPTLMLMLFALRAADDIVRQFKRT